MQSSPYVYTDNIYFGLDSCSSCPYDLSLFVILVIFNLGFEGMILVLFVQMSGYYLSFAFHAEICF